MLDSTYKNSFFIALGFHLFLIVLLCWESSHSHPVLMTEKDPKPSIPIINATSLDSKAVAQAVETLKEEKSKQAQAEKERLQAAARQVALAKEQRIQEQRRLEQLKKEAESLALARKKQMEQEKRQLAEIAQQKEKEAKRLEALKQQQALEQKKLEAAAKKAEEKARIAQEAKLKAEQEAKAKAAKEAQAKIAQNKAEEAAEHARVAGEIDKYKALIINAISRHWILPENADSSLSSQFRIRLAPDGAVLQVSLIRSSGDAILDRSAQAAIYKASPLPVPSDPVTFNLFRDISLTVRPENVRG